jgi:hypothetical protein
MLMRLARGHGGPSPLVDGYYKMVWGLSMGKIIIFPIGRDVSSRGESGVVDRVAFREHAQRRGEVGAERNAPLRRRAWHSFFS